MNQQAVIQPPGAVQGRAARGEHGTSSLSCISSASFLPDDYYDTEDPSVNLQEFIVNSMQVSVVLCSIYVYLVQIYYGVSLASCG